MFTEQKILDQLNIKNNSELCRILKSKLRNNNIKVDFESEHNYYKISGNFCVDQKFWKLKNGIRQKNYIYTTGNNKKIKERIDKLIKDRKFEMYKVLCHRGHLIGRRFKPYIDIKTFNFSENNPKNIYPQWINANDNNFNHSGIFGQAYFEEKVVNWLENGEEVLYKVVPIFTKDTNLYPIGNVIIAAYDENKKEILNVEDGSEHCIKFSFDEEDTNKFCVFIPNYLDTDIVDKIVKKNFIK
ncbi:DNA/RNA non-specific endonuclease [uncultured Granulicatella sp.]|uniref:DNA/RNA non-specific endonuclease n=1 Tax=uncultured Granulicatella sp. TaxID=316089 RepID=UPI0028D5FB96|nr:DNA/RNA non-specific endonuclease [uncultured Granulicatella sp.]